MFERLEDLVAEISMARVYEHIAVFSEQIGTRLSSSTAEQNAAVYFYNELASYGLIPEFEPFDAYVDRPTSNRLQITHPETRFVMSESLAWCGSTGLEGVTAPIIDVGFGTHDEFERVADQIPGHIVIATAGKVWRGLALLWAERYGGVGLVWVGTGPGAPINNLGMAGIHLGNPLSNTNFPGIPGLGVHYETGEMLRRLLKDGEVTVRMDVERERSWRRSQNVHAVCYGNTYPDQVVVVGAHLDNWGPGAYDSGSQLGGLLELARVIAERKELARTVQFSAWGAHEHGAIGSLHHTFESNATGVDRDVVGHVNFAVLMGGQGQKRANLRTHTSPEIRHFTADLVSHYGWSDGWVEDSPFWDVSDHLGYFLRGVPTIQPRGWYLGVGNPYYHSFADTYRNLNFDDENALDYFRLSGGMLLSLSEGVIPGINYGALSRDLLREVGNLAARTAALDFDPLVSALNKLESLGDAIFEIVGGVRSSDPSIDPATSGRLARSYLAPAKTIASRIYDLRRMRQGEQILEVPGNQVGLMPVFLAIEDLENLAETNPSRQRLVGQLTREVSDLSATIESAASDLTSIKGELAELAK